METVLEKLLYVGSTVAVSLVTYLMGKRKQEAETDSTTLANLEKSLEIYQLMINDMSIKIDGLTKKINELELTIDKLYQENKVLKYKVQ